MNEQAFWNELERRVAKYDLLCHPFYKAWSEGRLTRDDLREYAGDYYHHVAAFPRYLDELQSRLPEGALREAIVGNWEEEMGVSTHEVTAKQGRAHDELWLQFAEAMGADVQQVRAGQPIEEVRDLIDTFSRTAREGLAAEALAAFYAYESQVPRIATEKERGLRAWYGAGDAACEYFTLHATADVRHSKVWRNLIDRLLAADPAQTDAALDAAENAAQALWRALDGIEARRQATQISH
jgi:pyrroloquinoline-quinone synthase